MRLSQGQDAKAFEVTDIRDQRIALADYKGKKLMLAFFRYAGCPLCNLRIHHLIQRYPGYQAKGLNIVAFFESSKDTILQYTGKQNPPFPIVPDPECKIYDLYGVETSLLGYFLVGLKVKTMIQAMAKFKPGKMENRITLVPADFLIGPDQKIHKIHYGKDIADHMPIEEVDRFAG